ncbi:GNAT family N-acetyltransferase [Flavobacterium cerinum]|uniref:GNAT family N-acetyltransferase n=1 Tax=Flavobacterium cerinum TaxID=2502784 RepID=UPI001F503522|nr:GNAT family N-acetyltransferase [Flavobacterium cerinum]
MGTVIKLQKFTDIDFPNYFQLVNNEQVMEMITERSIQFGEAKKDYQELLENNSIASNFGSFKILDVISNEFIGLAKLEIKDKDSNEAEIGYMILPQYWGKGIGSAVAKELLEMAVAQTSINKLNAIIDPKNLASRKILINNGFVSKEFIDFDGLPGELLEFKI